MSKRPSLAEKMRQAAAVPDTVPTATVPQPVPTPAEHSRSADAERRFYAATRVGKKKVTATLAPSDHKRLRQLALERDTTTEALLSEAISDLFTKYGQPGIGQGRGA